MFKGHISVNRTRPRLLTRPPPRSPPPPEYRWDDVGGVNYLTVIRNQVNTVIVIIDLGKRGSVCSTEIYFTVEAA